MTALDHVAITVKDLNRAIDFYSKVLGFPVVKVKEKPEFGVTYALL